MFLYIHSFIELTLSTFVYKSPESTTLYIDIDILFVVGKEIQPQKPR